MPPVAQVLDGEGAQMITTMDEFVQKVKADLVVMASHVLSGQVRPVRGG